MSDALERAAPFEWLSYYNEDSTNKFGGWIAMKDWSELFSAASSDAKAECYQREVTATLEEAFPLVTCLLYTSPSPRD